MPVLQSIDEEARKAVVSSTGSSVTLEKVKGLLAEEFAEFHTVAAAQQRNQARPAGNSVATGEQFQICGKNNHKADKCHQRYQQSNPRNSQQGVQYGRWNSGYQNPLFSGQGPCFNGGIFLKFSLTDMNGIHPEDCHSFIIGGAMEM